MSEDTRRERIAERVARDIGRGWAVNLGIGLPLLVAPHIGCGEALVHSENGILGVGGRVLDGGGNRDLVDAGKQPVWVVPGACFFDSLMSFGLMRGGHLDLAVMGAYQVSADGDLANWRLPDRRIGGLGGAVDLAAGAREVWVAMEHVDRLGRPRLLDVCGFPLTARRVVRRIYTDLGVLTPKGDGRFEIVELAEGATMNEVQALTGAEVVRALPPEAAPATGGSGGSS